MLHHPAALSQQWPRVRVRRHIASVIKASYLNIYTQHGQRGLAHLQPQRRRLQSAVLLECQVDREAVFCNISGFVHDGICYRKKFTSDADDEPSPKPTPSMTAQPWQQRSDQARSSRVQSHHGHSTGQAGHTQRSHWQSSTHHYHQLPAIKEENEHYFSKK